MSEECCSNDVSDKKGFDPICSECGKKGKVVDRMTIAALLKPEIRRGFPKEDKFGFCREPECPTVYFGSGKTLFKKSDLTIRVAEKEKEDPRYVCYCFGYTEKMVYEEVAKTGKSIIPDEIKTQVKNGNCYCEITNPQGSCCLGNVSATVKAAIEKGGIL